MVVDDPLPGPLEGAPRDPSSLRAYPSSFFLLSPILPLLPPHLNTKFFYQAFYPKVLVQILIVPVSSAHPVPKTTLIS